MSPQTMLQKLVLLLFLSPVLLRCVVSLTHNCSINQYWQSTLSACLFCTNCTVNQIIYQPCAINTDRICGPFKDFNGTFPNGDKSETRQINVLEARITTAPYYGHLQGIHKDTTDQWKKLAFSLIAVLCVLIIAATIIVFVSCKHYQSSKFGSEPENGGKYHKRGSRRLTAESEGSGEYVVIRRRSTPAVFIMEEETDINPPQRATLPIDFHANQRNRYHRMRRMYRPQRRLMNEYVDDVFESEDSGGSRSVRLPLHTIPERSETETS